MVNTMPNRFATTRWSLVVAAGGGTPQARAALEELCTKYWYPLYAFARRKGHSAEDAADLVQGYFAGLLQRDDLSAADPRRGRFRSWLLAGLQHALANERDRAAALKRGGGTAVVSLDAEDGERRYGLEPTVMAEAERLYERRWALSLIEGVLERLEAECRTEGKSRLFAALKAELAGGAAASHEALAETLGMTPGAVKVAVHRLRRQFRDLLRAEVAHTVETPEQIDDEIRALMEALN